MIYAPVIIPTLNRFEHLKKCIDSLSKNHNADKTEVFISIDFPPSEKYKEGHNKICDYLDKCQFNFKKIHIYKQTKNLGVNNGGGKRYSNSSFLIDIVSKEFDRWIFSEDDNYFAPGFLDFMNICLEKYEDDPTVYSICGYRFYYNLKFKGNNFFRQHTDFNAWGYAVWKRKYEIVSNLEVDYLKRILYNPYRVYKIWKVSNLKMIHLSAFSKRKNFKKGDNFLTLYMIDNNMTQIMPARSLVRNLGWDESGLHCVGFSVDVINKHLNQEIDERQYFGELKGTGWEFFDENQKIIKDEDFQQSSFVFTALVYIKRLLFFWE